MIRILAALLATLVAAPAAQDKKPDKPPQEELPTEMKWELQKDDLFEFKWTYDEARRIFLGKSDSIDTSERKDVLAEVSFVPKDGGPGTIVLTLKKVLWSVSSPENEVVITYAEGKKVDVQVKVKVEPKGGAKVAAQSREAAKAQADLLGENMRKLVEGDYTIAPNFRKNETMILRNGAVARPGLFDKLFMHSPLPTGSAKVGQTWKDPLDNVFIPQGLIDVSTIDYKVPAINATSITVKAGIQIPILKPPTVTDQKITGSYIVNREYVFHRAGYLQNSKEDVTYQKKVDASGKDAAFYREDSNVSSKQALTIKKKAPPAKPEEKEKK